MNILVIGGTRFVGKYLVSELNSTNHRITLFTRGNNPVPTNVEHIKGDRGSEESLASLRGRKFDVIVDSSGRTLEDTKKVLSFTGAPLHRLVYVSSAGVYADSYNWPLKESSELDPNSRHYGKVETENWLTAQGIPFTSFRPTYIYGPGNYNPIERWFFDRIVHNRPIPLPGDGNFITQLGHVADLAKAMLLSIESSVAVNKIYNCSGNQGITLRGLVYISAKACGKDPSQLTIKPFDPSLVDQKQRKSFPLRIGHFFSDINLVKKDLKWEPRFDLEKGFDDSYKNDYLLLTSNNPDFSADEKLFPS